MIPEYVNEYFKSNQDTLVKTKGIGSFCFWYRQPSGHYKTVCRTRFNYRNKGIKRIWFRIKLFFYKLTHDTNYHAPKKFDSITYINNRKNNKPK